MKTCIFSILMAFAFAACSPTTHITGSWKNPTPPKNPTSFKSVMVTSLSQNPEARQTVEGDLSAAVSATGVKALRGMDHIPPSFSDGKDIDKDDLLSKIRKTGVDGILTIALIDQETENRYVPGDYGYAPVTRFRYYGRFSGYYTMWYPAMITPGYYVQDKIYFIEVNFYDAKSEELIWSAQSETYNPSSLAQFSKEFSRVIANKMQQDGVLNTTR